MTRTRQSLLALGAGLLLGALLLPVTRPGLRRLFAGDGRPRPMPGFETATAFLRARSPRPRWPSNLPDTPAQGGMWRAPDGSDARPLADSAAWEWARQSNAAFPGVRESAGDSMTVKAWDELGPSAVRGYLAVPAGGVVCGDPTARGAGASASLRIDLRRVQGNQWRVAKVTYPDCTLGERPRR